MDNDIVINGYEITDDFIKKYEAYMEMIKDCERGELYKINLTLSDAGVEAGFMEEFEPPNETGFVKLNEREAILFIEIIDLEIGTSQIEIEMFYALEYDHLEHELYGTYTWECVRLCNRDSID